MSIKTTSLNYTLPKKYIAQKPKIPRNASNLLVFNTAENKISHLKFGDIAKILKKGDVIVLNDSKVIPARLFAKKSTGGKTEILLLKKIGHNLWEAMLKNYKAKERGKPLYISHKLKAEPIKNINKNIWQIKFNSAGKKIDNLIFRHGKTPTPPYIKTRIPLKDYQTVYAKKSGSVAAPTAGLHFTKKLINALKKGGVIFEKITLHIGLGTFAPIKEEFIENHQMHSETAIISKKTAFKINKTKKGNKRIIAIGTTSARCLESFAKNGILDFGTKATNILIKPGYNFQIINGLITNFHLPKSTNILLAAALLQYKNPEKDGIEMIKKIYNLAIKKNYRFYSFGDAMLII